MELNREVLLTFILSWYAEYKHWTSGINYKPKAIIDQGKLAKSAINARSIGELLVVFCNSINISMSEVGHKCEIPMPRMTEIIMTNTIITPEESKIIWKILDEEYKKFYEK